MKFKGIAKGKARENLPEYPIQISIVYSIPQHLLWFKNYKLIDSQTCCWCFFCLCQTMCALVDEHQKEFDMGSNPDRHISVSCNI